MANELSISVSLTFNKGGAAVSRSEGIQVNVTGDAFSHEVMSIPTSVTALVVGGGITTSGYILIKNMDASNYVTLGLSGQYSIKLKAGEVALFRAAAPIYALANTGACLVEYLIIEE